VTEGFEVLIGSNWRDTLVGNDLDNTIFGGGGDGNDSIVGGGGNDSLIGSPGQDTFDGGAGNDTVQGGNGNDFIAGGAGADSLDGGGGSFDRLDYTNSSAGVNVNLATGAASGGDAAGDSFANFEDLGGSNLGDTLTGNILSNNLTGQGGNDLIAGGGGADNLLGGSGADTLDYSASTAPVNIVFDQGDVFNGTGGDAQGDFGSGFEAVIGSSGNDTIRGYTFTDGTGQEILFGGAGNDSLIGGGDNDTLIGGAGEDSLFAGSGNDLLVGGGGDLASGDTGNDTLAFELDGVVTISGSLADFTYTLPGGGTGIGSSIEFIRDAAGNPISVASIFGGGTTGTLAVCFAEGTRILTARGEVEVERLQPGDLVATVAGEGPPVQPVVWIGRRRIALAGHPQAAELAPVRIRAGALGPATPHRDLLVSPDHCLLLDGALVPARLLVDGAGITVEASLAEVTYLHVELEGHAVLLAEGAAAESWLDAGNRPWFANADVALMAVAGPLDSCATEEATPCVPVLLGGPRLAAIRDAIGLRGTPPGDAPRRRAAG